MKYFLIFFLFGSSFSDDFHQLRPFCQELKRIGYSKVSQDIKTYGRQLRSLESGDVFWKKEEYWEAFSLSYEGFEGIFSRSMAIPPSNPVSMVHSRNFHSKAFDALNCLAGEIPLESTLSEIQLGGSWESDTLYLYLVDAERYNQERYYDILWGDFSGKKGIRNGYIRYLEAGFQQRRFWDRFEDFALSSDSPLVKEELRLLRFFRSHSSLDLDLIRDGLQSDDTIILRWAIKTICLFRIVPLYEDLRLRVNEIFGNARAEVLLSSQKTDEPDRFLKGIVLETQKYFPFEDKLAEIVLKEPGYHRKVTPIPGGGKIRPGFEVWDGRLPR